MVGVDSTTSAGLAAGWATRLSDSVRLVHAAADGKVPDWLLGLAAATAATPEVVAGAGDPDAVAALLRERARGAAMLVVGGHGRSAHPGLQAGDLAAGLAADPPCPVAVVHGLDAESPLPATGPVVVGTDGGPAGTAALDAAADLARTLGADLVVVHAWTDVAPGAHRRTDDPEVLAEHGREVTEAARRRVAERQPGLAVETDPVQDTALRALLHRAERAQVLVVAPRVGTPPPAAAMQAGSTTRSLVAFAPCPVVVVPLPG
ncbi:hypothetical protein GCM10023175_16980 [Pseudonocardia xishanensis]|uniref:UspA domain-containing protein n=1 Tax=Pseudonocardia xishanensis TaxID=630995 RepID=A0ABP8RLY0_9PSEU